MKKQQILFWIILLIIIDQSVKIVINSFFLDSHFEIIPVLIEFKPIFNDKHSYVNALIDKHFGVNLGLWFHIILFLFIQIIFLILYSFWRNNTSSHKKLLDTAFAFQVAGLVCALIGNVIWEKGILDFIYLKPLFIFDLKDLYINCFVILFLIFVFKNKTQFRTLKTKDLTEYAKDKLTRKNTKVPDIQNDK